MKTQNTTTKPDAGQLNLFASTGNNNRQRYQRTEKTKVAPTSTLAYFEERAKGAFQTMKLQILSLLKGGEPMTRRQLAKAIGKDASDLCQALAQLQKSAVVEIAYLNKCPSTGRLVSWFRLGQNKVVESLTKEL